jgi:hypothetical protein
MKLEWNKLEPVGYLLALLAAVFLRVWNLNQLPLTSLEAGWAVQALQLARGNMPPLGPNPGYTALTTILFFILGTTNAMARLAPVLVGSSLILVPYFFRERLGRGAALVLAFGMALDPFMVANSRLAGGPMLVLGFGLWALVAWKLRSGAAAGILLGLAILSGPAFWFLFVSLGLAFLVFRVIPGGKQLSLVDQQGGPISLRLLAASLLVTIIVVGTIFTLMPEGLGAFAASLPAYLQTWWTASGVPAWQIVLALLVYQPLAFVFGLVHGVRKFRAEDGLDRLLLLWALIAFLLGVLMPGRQPTDLVWVVLPLWVLASRELAGYLSLRSEGRLATLLETGLVFVLLLVGWLNLAAMVVDGNNLRWYFTLGVLIIAAIATYLIGAGWSFGAAIQGLVWGLCLALGVLVLGEALATARPRSDFSIELWQVQPLAGSVSNFVKSMGDLSEWNTGRRDSLDVVVLKQDANLAWVLKNFPNATYTDALNPDQLPSTVITAQDAPEPELSLPYRGQNFDWEIRPDWSGMGPSDWLNWLFYREAPIAPVQITIWARNDLFPGGELVPDNSTPADSSQPDQLVPGNQPAP